METFQELTAVTIELTSSCVSTCLEKTGNLLEMLQHTVSDEVSKINKYWISPDHQAVLDKIEWTFLLSGL